MSAMMYEDFKYRAENVVKLNKDKTATEISAGK